jgi:capsular polysaccharide biosynthesis protein
MAARRRRRLWVSMAFAGLVLGAALHVVLPSKISAVSKVYLVEPTNQDPTAAIASDVNLLQTRKVAETAMSILHLSPNQPVIAYKAAALGTSIVAIKVSAPSASAAKAETNAVAQAFLEVRNQIQTQVTTDQVTSLRADEASLQADLGTVTSQISRLQGPSATRNALTDRQTNDSTQISSDQQQITQATQSESLVTKSSGVLDPAYIVVTSTKKTAIKDGLSGLVAGLALGLGIVVVGELLSDRPRHRADVAAALGAPVELSVGRLP